MAIIKSLIVGKIKFFPFLRKLDIEVKQRRIFTIIGFEGICRIT